MTKIALTIDGNRFSDLETFYSEMDRILTKDLNWQTGHNLDALNDLLRGGFGVYGYEEPVKITWTNFRRSQKNLGSGLTQEIVKIIHDHKHIEFTTTD